MNKIISKVFLSENVARFEIEAPRIAKNRKAGHFIIVKIGEEGERIPYTIADADPDKGTISLIVQRVGTSSRKLLDLNTGDFVTDLVGPLGQPTHIDNFGTVLCVSGGVGIAPMYPITQAMKEKGNRIISVLAGRSKNLIILEDEIRKYSDEVIIMTDDGSYGEKGLITKGVEKVLESGIEVNQCVVTGPPIMMKVVSDLTKNYNVPTIASLNTIMVDGTGMCGACRVSVGGETKFVCVDGPEFDAHQVDFNEMIMRMKAYKN